MPQSISKLASSAAYLDRREAEFEPSYDGPERRQFSDSRDHFSPEAKELAGAIDGYKLRHRRRFITFEEMAHIIKSLGYVKTDAS